MNVIQLKRKSFRANELEVLRQCCESYGYTLEVALSDENEQYIVVYGHLGPLVHIGLLPNGGVFADGRDLGYSEHSNINSMIRTTSRKLQAGLLKDKQA